MNGLEELAGQGKLLCPDTRSPALVRDGRVVSAQSGRDFGPLSGPLNFLKAGEETIEASEVPPADVERVRVHLQLPPTVEVAAEIARAIAATGMRFGQSHLSAEARILAERFQIPAFELESAAPAPRGSTLGRFAAAIGKALTPSARTEYRLEHVSHSVGERLTVANEVWRSVRVRSAGNTVLPAASAKAARVDVRWAAADGSVLPHCTVSTELPVDIEPGREITLILRMRAPADPGTYSLCAHLVVPGEPEAPPFLTTTVETVRCELPIFEYAYFRDLLEYGADHHIAMLEAAAFLEERYPDRKASILEIGGGVHPTGHSLAGMGHKVVSSDISHSQSILGTLYFRHLRPDLENSLAFISCEGTDLPLADASFDGVMLISAFHHFADPIALLHEMNRVSRPGGFVFIGCETCAPNPADPTYREELRRGINEQMWTLAEFTDFFRKTGLRVMRARVDGHSLKVGLVKGDGG